MRFVLLFVLLVPLVTAWTQCGSPSERVIKLDSVNVETAIKNDQHWARITITGETTRAIPASAVIQKSVRMGAIRLPLPDTKLGEDFPAGPFSYKHEEIFQAPSGIVTHVKLTLVDAGKTLACIKDLEVDL